MSDRPLRVALLDNGATPATRAAMETLASSLRQRGHHAERITATASAPALVRRAAQASDLVMRKRGFAVPLAHVPLVVLALLRGHFDVAHASSPADAVAGIAWGRISGRPTVFTSVVPVRRDLVADRRLSLALLRRATEESAEVLAATDDSRVALLRWFAIDAPVLDPGDGPAHEQRYRTLIGGG